MEKLTKEELQNLINISGQVSVPVASQQAETVRLLINKLSRMMDELNPSVKDTPKEKKE